MENIKNLEKQLQIMDQKLTNEALSNLAWAIETEKSQRVELQKWKEKIKNSDIWSLELQRQVFIHMSEVAENLMEIRAFIAENKQILKENLVRNEK